MIETVGRGGVRLCEWARGGRLWGRGGWMWNSHPDCAKKVSEQVCLDRGAQGHLGLTALHCCAPRWI